MDKTNHPHCIKRTCAVLKFFLVFRKKTKLLCRKERNLEKKKINPLNLKSKLKLNLKNTHLCS